MLWLTMLSLAAAPAPTRVDGGLTLATVQDVLAFRQADFVCCFDGGADAVALEWRVSVAGLAEDIRSAPSTVPPSAACIRQTLGSLEFPPGTETWVAHSFSKRAAPLPPAVEPCDGGLSPDQVTSVVRDRSAEVARCYAAAHLEKPKLEGRFTLLLKVGPSGSVLAGSIEEGSEGIKASSVGACVLAGARSWRFGASKDGHPRLVRQPFLLAASQAYAQLHLRPNEPEMVAIFDIDTRDGGGGLSKRVIAAVIKSHQNEIKFCFEVQLQKAPTLAGKVTVAFAIEPDGRVSGARVSEATLANADVHRCMIDRISKWTFPEPINGGKVAVTFPWIFRPADPEKEDDEW